MKHPVALLLLLGFCYGAAAAQTAGFAADSMTIETAIDRVLTTHPAVQQATAGVEAATARIGQARSSYYPNAAIDLSYARIGPVPTFDFPGFGSFALFPENNYDMHIGATALLLDFGRRSTAVDLSQTGVQTASDLVTTVRTGLAFQTIQAFYAILFLQESVGVQDQELAALHQHLDVNQKRVEGGSATEFEVMTTRVRLAAAETRRIDLLSALRNQQLTLMRLLGQPTDSLPPLKGNFDLIPVTLREDSLTVKAFEHRSELAATRDARRTADLQHRLATLEDYPSLSMNLQYGFKNGYIPNLDVLRGNWVAGVLLQFPIFNGFRTRSREEETAAMSKSAEANQLVVERTVMLEVQEALEGVRSASAKVGTSNAQVQQAANAVRNARVQYEAGAATNLDLLDAETSLAQAQLAQLSAVYQYTLSRYSLDRATGMLPVGADTGKTNR